MLQGRPPLSDVSNEAFCRPAPEKGKGSCDQQRRVTTALMPNTEHAARTDVDDEYLSTATMIWGAIHYTTPTFTLLGDLGLIEYCSIFIERGLYTVGELVGLSEEALLDLIPCEKHRKKLSKVVKACVAQSASHDNLNTSTSAETSDVLPSHHDNIESNVVHTRQNNPYAFNCFSPSSSPCKEESQRPESEGMPHTEPRSLSALGIMTAKSEPPKRKTPPSLQNIIPAAAHGAPPSKSLENTERAVSHPMDHPPPSAPTPTPHSAPFLPTTTLPRAPSHTVSYPIPPPPTVLFPTTHPRNNVGMDFQYPHSETQFLAPLPPPPLPLLPPHTLPTLPPSLSTPATAVPQPTLRAPQQPTPGPLLPQTAPGAPMLPHAASYDYPRPSMWLPQQPTPGSLHLQPTSSGMLLPQHSSSMPPPSTLPSLSSPVYPSPPSVCVVDFKCHTATHWSPVVLSPGVYVIVEGDRGEDLGWVTQCSPVGGTEGTGRERGSSNNNNNNNDNPNNNLLPVVRRLASMEEIVFWRTELHERATHALGVGRRRAGELGLELELLEAEFQMDQNKLTLYYRSKARVEFVALLKVLYRDFGCRIWMERVEEGVDEEMEESRG